MRTIMSIFCTQIGDFEASQDRVLAHHVTLHLIVSQEDARQCCRWRSSRQRPLLLSLAVTTNAIRSAKRKQEYCQRLLDGVLLNKTALSFNNERHY
jgi:hypothetical protein